MDLKRKTITGLFWSFFSQGGRYIGQFIITAILARFLSPNDFGLLAMATVFINFAMIFSEMGISSALIQKQDTTSRHYYSAFWLNIIVGICLTLIIIVSSTAIAKFYKRPELKSILSVISINFFIASFAIVKQALLTKEMDFRKLATIDMVAVIISGIAGILLAYKGFGVWSLVFQSIIFTSLNTIILWLLSPWRPRLIFAKSDIKDIFRFSANLTGFNIVNYFARNIDYLLIGKFLGSQALGYYMLAYRLMLMPIYGISVSISRVIYPAFSKIQSDFEKVKSSYLKMVKAISLVTFPAMLTLIILAPEFVSVVFGEKWAPATLLIQILSICGMLQSVSAILGNIRLSQGRAGFHLKIGILNGFFACLAIVIGLNWGVYGVALAYTLFSVLWFYYTNFVTLPLIKLPIKEFFKALKKPFLISICLTCFLVLIKSTIHLGQLNMLILLAASSALLYIALLLSFKQVNWKIGDLRIY